MDRGIFFLFLIFLLGISYLIKPFHLDLSATEPAMIQVGLHYQPQKASADLILKEETFYFQPIFTNKKPKTLLLSKKIKSYLVEDFNHSIKFKKNHTQIYPLASLTKLMTALIATEVYKKNEIFEIDKESLKITGNYIDLKIGEHFNRDQMIAMMLLASSNDIAYALAKKIGQEKFVELMNQKAQSLNLKSFKFVEPTGLNPENQGSAEDIVNFLFYLYQNHPQILKITQNESQEIISQEKIAHQVKNTNKLIQKYQDIIIGGKTGFLEEVGGNLALLVKIKEKIIGIVLIGSAERFQDAEKIINYLQNYE